MSDFDRNYAAARRSVGADRAIAIEDIELPEGEIRILRPGVRHPANLQAVARSMGVASKVKA